MCLTCHRNHTAVKGKENIKQIFTFPDWAMKVTEAGYGHSGNLLHTHDGKEIKLQHRQLKEICDHALAVIVTGVDTRIDVWAIQWPNDYKVKTL